MTRIQRMLFIIIGLAGLTAIAADVYVTTEYGKNLVLPNDVDENPDVADVAITNGTPFTFTAPTSIYLDRYGKELETTGDNLSKVERIAYARADCIGYDVTGPPFQGDGSLTSFVAIMDAALRVTWRWQLKSLRAIDSATGSFLDDGLDPGVGNPSPAVGLDFLPRSQDGGPLRLASIDGVVESPGDPVRFKHRGYILENTPAATDHYIAFEGDNGGKLGIADDRSDNIGIVQGGDFSLDFWCRIEPVESSDDQSVFMIGHSGTWIQVGFRKNTHTGNGFSGNEFFVSTGYVDLGDFSYVETAAAEADAAFTDNSWHHWAVTYDASLDNTVTIYRDGLQVARVADIPLSTDNNHMVIGSPVYGFGENGKESFIGGINNLRLWKSINSLEQVKESLGKESYGDNQAGTLVLELGFDTVYTQSDNVNSATFTSAGGLAFNDGTGVTIPLSIDADPDSVINRITVSIDSIIHPYNSDIKVELISPEETSIILFAGLGASGDNISNLILDSQGGTALPVAGTTLSPWTGTYALGALNQFQGENANGTWKLKVSDTFPGADDGNVHGVTLNITSESYVDEPHQFLSEWVQLSTEGNKYRFTLSSLGVAFPAAASPAQKKAAVFPGFIYFPSNSQNPPPRVQTPVNAMDDWWRVTWLWEKQYRLDISAVDPETQGVRFADMPFVRGEASFDGVSDPTNELWVDDGAFVDVGTYFRTTDDCYVLRNIVLASGSLDRINLDTLEDGSLESRVTRQVNGIPITGPGSVVWQYDKTVFRAEIALGSYLDVTDTASADLQLVPNLCDNATLDPAGWLRIVESRPDSTGIKSIGNAADVLLYDQIHKRVWPTQPGRFRVEWPDATSNATYLVEIICDFPTDVVDFHSYPHWRENDDGTRQGNHPDYVRETTMVDVSDAFPSSPSAHYTHLATPGDQPPANLEKAEADRWKFNRMTVATAANAFVNGTAFSATGAGRTVMVWTYTDDPLSTAMGDLDAEGYLVRVVESKLVESRTQDDDLLANDLRQVFVPQAASPLIVGTSGGSQPPAELQLRQSDAFSIDFWSQLNADTTVNHADAALFSFGGEGIFGGSWSFEVGYRNRTGANADADRLYLTQSGPTGADTDTVTVPVTADGNWHHWTIVYQGQASSATARIFRDGALVAELATDEARLNDSGYSSATFALGVASDLSSRLLDGKIDNFRFWDKALSQKELRETMTTNNATLTVGSAPEALLTLDWDGGNASNVVSSAGGLAVIKTSNGTNAAGVMVLDSFDTHPEVAARLYSKLDGANFGSGYLLNAISNYNTQIYNRQAKIGFWGGIYPTNWSGLYTASNRRLDVVYYENFNRGLATALGATTEAPLDVLHPAVDWPTRVVRYDNVDYPDAYPIDTAQTHNRIYIASRLGTEGYSNDGVQQRVYDPELFDGLTVYNQPERTAPGFNPNEEHAVVYDSIQAFLTGTTAPNIRPKAAFALQNGGLNQTNRTELLETYSSDPWVLVQYLNRSTDTLEMAAYKVEETRSGSELFPRLDAQTHSPKDALNQPVGQPTNPTYDFDYPIFAGDLVLAPYPLNLVVGAFNLGAYNVGGNVKVDHDNNGATPPIPQRTVWKDVNANNWCVSGNGRFFFQNWYPLRSDFWFDQNGDGDGRSDLAVSTPLAWLPTNAEYLNSATADPIKSRYASYWNNDYPILKRGETVTFAGGENKAENFDAEGLPAVLAWASGQVVYDDRMPTMALDDSNVDDFTARLIRPLDRHEAAFTQAQMEAAGLVPAETDKIMVIGARWYFKELDGSLQKRFYYDSLLSKLVFRGRVNDKEGGAPNLTESPVSLSVLEANVMTKPECLKLRERSSSADWLQAITAIYDSTQNPHDVAGVTPGNLGNNKAFWAGVQDKADEFVEQYGFYTETDANGRNAPGTSIAATTASNTQKYQPLNSLGVGAALVPNPALLAANPDLDGDGQPDPLYITLAENNHPDAGGAVSIHIIEIGPARFRGAIKMIEAQNVFDEKINLQHSGDFGANTDDVYYQWWRREVVPLDQAGLPVAEPEWQVLEQGLGLHKIEVAGNPAVMLADSLFFVRYGEMSEFVGPQDDPDADTVADDSWRLVDFDDDTWLKTSSTAVPYQYAGAFNSPQLQADGSKRYIPQLAMGWVKRVLDRINPYEARYSDFYGNESPATYSSQIQIAGGPYNGKVALNADKDVIENVGLIELYETVLARAKELTLDTGGATDGTNQALLLAATRLATLYELLAREAYSDAQNPTVPVTTDNGIAGVGGYVHAFQNQEADLLHEELALLRGSDFLKAYPAQNRLFWNYVKGLGEAAYNAVYNIHDENEDGFINEFDAAKLYPQGHGDAWGHFVSANNMHYELLNDGNSMFSWRSRAELYGLLDNVIEADYLDEKSFARIAAAKARTGLEIVRATYREAYTEDPAGQWQGYTDIANPARAWGVSEWGARAGQGAYFDWLVGNAVVPLDADQAQASEQENLHDIDRRANVAELAEIAAAGRAIQATLDDANSGSNPLGFDSDGIAFDIDPSQLDARNTHFEQIYARAVTALNNANATLDHASAIDNQVRSIANDTRDLQVAALRQDIDYRNRLIELFGTPYDGKIGPGQVYAEGYTGPDMLLFMYVDRNQVSQVMPTSAPQYTNLFTPSELGSIARIANKYNDVDFDLLFGSALTNSSVAEIFDAYNPTVAGTTPTIDGDSLRVNRTSKYAFLAQDQDGTGWGVRGAYGQIQMTLSEMLAEEVALRQSVADYEAQLRKILMQWERIQVQLNAQQSRNSSGTIADAQILVGEIAERVGEAVAADIAGTRDVALAALSAVQEAPPAVIGFSNDATSTIRVGLRLPKVAISGASATAEALAKAAALAGSALRAFAEAGKNNDAGTINDFLELHEQVSLFKQMTTEHESSLLEISGHLQRFNTLLERLQSEKAEGFRLLDEREAFNMTMAASVQRNRYSDMIARITRNESLTSYNAAFENATKFAWLAAKAYDYETSLDAGDPAAVTSLFDRLVRTRSIGQLVDGAPQDGQGGIAEILSQMNLNFTTLKGQLGINNPQLEVGRLSVRRELMRIGDGSRSDANWRKALLNAQVDDLWQVSEFRQYCRPFADPADGAQPGIVLDFGTEINSGYNVFGKPLGGGDHAYSSANYATKIRSLGVWFDNYNDAGLATAPRVYLVPVGMDVLRLANSQYPTTRTWNVVEQKIPVPFLFNTEHLGATNFLPKVHTLNGSFADLRRFGDFRAYHDSGGTQTDMAQMVSDSRLIGRSVWNTRWLLIIPGATLHGDKNYGIEQFVDSVRDIRLQFETYSHQGD